MRLQGQANLAATTAVGGFAKGSSDEKAYEVFLQMNFCYKYLCGPCAMQQIGKSNPQDLMLWCMCPLCFPFLWNPFPNRM
jgi:hypothetical protein